MEYKEGSMYNEFKRGLMSNGLFDNEADGVMEYAMARKENDSMIGKWANPVTDYSKPVISAIWIGVKAAAVEWLDKNAPNHWAKALFAS